MVGAAALASTAALAAAQPTADPHGVQPERPTVATHAGVVAPGWIEIETGAERDGYGGIAYGIVSPTNVKIGLGHRAQLNVLGNVYRGAPSVGGSRIGVGEVTVGVKLRLLEHAPVVSDLAILPAVKLPTGSAANGFGTGTTDASLLLISSRTIGRVAVDLNAGVTWRSGDGTGTPRAATVWTASFGGPVTARVGWVAEAFGYPGTHGVAGSASSVALLTGPTFLLRPWLALDAGTIVPLAGPQPHALYAGLVWNIGCVRVARRCHP